MKYLSLFSGIGAFEKALQRLGIQYELAGFSDIDKYAATSYCAIHSVDESMNLGDITKINENELPEDIDLITYGFPCQDISNAGKQKGFFNEDGTQTRSGLFFDALRIIEKTKPKVAIAENVKNLTSKKFSEQFSIVLNSLAAAGYNNYWQVLNAKDYGVPQNRERVFIVSVRKDIDTGKFSFPDAFPLELRLKDLLEEKVDERFYINTDAAADLIRKVQTGEIDLDFTNTDRILKIGKINSSQDGVVVSAEGIAPTHTAGHGNMPKVLIREATKKGYAEAAPGDSINLEFPNSKTRRGRVGRGIAQTITTSPQQAVIEDDLRARKFTAKECFRLQAFDDVDFEKAASIISESQLYKQAGNSIAVNVPYYIFKELRRAKIL